MIVVHGPGPSHLFYDGPVHNHDLKNFHLKAMVMTFPHANSGIYFHTKYQEAGWPDQGFEAQVNATHGDWKKTGSLYDIKDIKDPHHEDEKWFLYEVIVKGNHVELKIDGKTVNDWTQPDDFTPPKGHAGRFLQHGTFALQGHDPGSKVLQRHPGQTVGRLIAVVAGLMQLWPVSDRATCPTAGLRSNKRDPMRARQSRKSCNPVKKVLDRINGIYGI